jgi:hypothetical protein
MRSMTVALSMAVLPFLAAPSLASKAAADACAAQLSPEAKQVYAATIGEVKPGIDLRETVRAKTKGLVIGGKLGRDQARPAAEAAGACLKQAM